MKFDRSSALLGIVIAVSLAIQGLSLATQYVGRFDGAACGVDSVDCGPSRYVIATPFGDIDLENGWMNVKEQKMLENIRLMALVIPLVLEIAAVATLIQHNRKK